MVAAPRTLEDKSEPRTLDSRLDQIRNSPNLESQKQTAVVLGAVEDTLREQNSEFTPTAYFAALLSLLGQYVSNAGEAGKEELGTAVVYLLDLITPHVPTPILRTKFDQILNSLAPALNLPQATAAFLRSAIGCLVSLVIAQDSPSWAQPQSQVGPRKALSGLLALAIDPRPKVRKRTQDGIQAILQNSPPGPSLDHPAAGMCAETALQRFAELAETSSKQPKKGTATEHDPAMIHVMQLIKAIAKGTNGWPTKNLESLCEVLFTVARSKSEFLTMNAFDVFEAVFEGMSKDLTFSKLPQLLEAVSELRPSQNDSQLLPPYLATISRGYDVSAQINPIETFQGLPELMASVAEYIASPSYNIRTSASECLISLFFNCVPKSVILEPSVYDEKVLYKIGELVTELLSVKFQSAWMDVFKVVAAAFEVLKWQSQTVLQKVVAIVGELRHNEGFAGKDQADEVLKKAISAMGPEAVLSILPLNLLSHTPTQPGRAWLLPLMRDSITNTHLAHFKKEFLPLSESLYQRILAAGQNKTMETKIFETLVQQIWSCLPGYCDRPLDVEVLDQDFAELICKLLYQQPEMRLTLCRALQNLVISFQAIVLNGSDEALVAQGRISKADAQRAVTHLSSLSSNLLAVLFNVYGETAAQQRGPILACIDSYMSITKPQELAETFGRVSEMLETAIKEQPPPANDEKSKPQKANDFPPMSHSLMDLVVTIAAYLPRESFQALFRLATIIVTQQQPAPLQKKAYKLIPRLAESESGRAAIQERNSELQQLLLSSAEFVAPPARRNRLHAMSEIVQSLPSTDLSFIPAILPEVILGTKEGNERGRAAAYDLIIAMGEKMQSGGSVGQAAEGGPSATASIEEYFTMLSAGLAGSTPHMISASVTALARALYKFHAQLTERAITELVSTMDLFLKTPTREIVASVLGFIKVCVLSLPKELMIARLPSVVPNLIHWSHEHKAHFKVKVKNILERMIRKYGVEVVQKHTPESDRKLITNIRKTHDRNKRKKTAGAEDAMEEDQDEGQQRNRFENEYDEAIYGSDDDPAESDEDIELRENGTSKNKSRRQTNTYIHEDEDEPLDLLSRNALANISSTKPMKPRQAPAGRKHKAKVDEDGKLLLRDDGEDDGDMAMGVDDSNMSLEQGINAYVTALRGKNAPQRGQRGKLKFKQGTARGHDGEGEGDEDEMDVDERPAPRLRGRGGRGGRGSRGPLRARGGGGIDKAKMQRPGLGVGKGRGDFVAGRGSRGRGQGRGRPGRGFRGRG